MDAASFIILLKVFSVILTFTMLFYIVNISIFAKYFHTFKHES